MQNTTKLPIAEDKYKKRKRRKRQVFIQRCLLVLFLLVIIASGLYLLFTILPLFHEDTAETFTGMQQIPVVESGKEEEAEAGDETAEDEPRPNPLTDGEYIICLDAGHGGSDIGSSYKSREERYDTMKLAKAVQKELENLGATVVMTRETDTKVTLNERSEAANDSNADLCISLHRNYGRGNGVETWIRSHPSELEQTLGTNIQEALAAEEIQRDRGLKNGTPSDFNIDYKMIRKNAMATCIIELGFINSPNDNSLFDAHYEDYAKAIAGAVDKTYQYYLTLPDDGTSLIGTSIDPSEVPKAESGEISEILTDTDSESENEDFSDANDTTDETITETILNETIPLTGLSAASQGWGPGVNVDDLNRPVGATQMQDKYGSYSAYFIRSESTDKNMYLTFDEGYENGYSASILDTLKEKNVKATFFVTKPYAEQNPELVQRMIDEGHTVGNHSVTHPSAGLPSQSIADQTNEVMALHDYMLDTYNYSMNLFRFPAGIFSEESLAIVNNCNYRSVFWSFAYKDYDVNNQMPEADALDKLVSHLHPGAIFLLHAVSSTNALVLGDFIDHAADNGYTFCSF